MNLPRNIPVQTCHPCQLVTDFVNYCSCRPFIFEQLDEYVTHKTALRLGGAARPSEVDLSGWVAYVHLFMQHPDLCRSLALVVR